MKTKTVFVALYKKIEKKQEDSIYKDLCKKLSFR